MFDRYDPRSDDRRERGDSWERSFGSRSGTSERDRDDHPRDVFTRDLDLPRGRDREHVRNRDRVYEINGSESRALATIGAFRVVAESDLHDLREDDSELKAQPQASRKGRADSAHAAKRRGSSCHADRPRARSSRSEPV